MKDGGDQNCVPLATKEKIIPNLSNVIWRIFFFLLFFGLPSERGNVKLKKKQPSMQKHANPLPPLPHAPFSAFLPSLLSHPIFPTNS